MGEKKYLAYLFLFILSISLCNARLEIGLIDGNFAPSIGLDLNLNPLDINYGGNYSINVNSSDNWVTSSLGVLGDANSTQFSNNGGVLNLLESWLGSLYCKLTGCTMSGDINMDGNDILMGGGNILDADMINATGEIFAAAFVVTNESSIFFGNNSINFTAKISAQKVSIGNLSRNTIATDANALVINTNHSGTSILGNININNGENASVAFTAVNYLGRGLSLLKFNNNHANYPDDAFFGNNFGNLRVSNQNHDTANVTLGFNDGTIRNAIGDITGIYNQTDVIIINNKLALIPFLTNFIFPVLFKNDTTIDANFNVTGNVTFDLDKVKTRKTDDQTITNGGLWNNITWDYEDFDSRNMHSNTTDNETITIKKDGYYLVSYHLKVESNDKISYNTRIIKNGVMLETACDTTVGSKELSFLTLGNSGNIFYLNTGDELVLQMNHDDVGGTADLVGANSYFLVYEKT